MKTTTIRIIPTDYNVVEPTNIIRMQYQNVIKTIKSYVYK